MEKIVRTTMGYVLDTISGSVGMVIGVLLVEAATGEPYPPLAWAMSGIIIGIALTFLRR